MADASAPKDVQHGSWLKSTASNGNGACVEVRIDPPVVSIRDSKYRRDLRNDPHREPIIVVSIDHWYDFLAEVASQVPVGHNRAITIEHRADGTVLRSEADGTALIYTTDEWSAFRAGVEANEFGVAEAGVA